VCRSLNFERAAHGVDDAAKFDDQPVAGALDHPAVVDGDRRVNQDFVLFLLRLRSAL
jgi:hypothetical protein